MPSVLWGPHCSRHLVVGAYSGTAAILFAGLTGLAQQKQNAARPA